MKKYLLVHDLGTTANKACLFDSAGRLAASRLQPLTTSYPDNNRAEQRPADWWQAVCDCTRSLLGESGVEPEAIACVSLCGHNPSAVLIDASGSPLFDSVPIYADLRAVEVADAVFQLLGGYDEFYRITGAGQIPAQYSCFKTAWLLRAFPEKGKNAWKLLNTMDYLAYRLTGRIATDYSQASNTGFLDIATRSWSRRILDALEISPDLLPEIIASTDQVGEVLPAVARRTGIPAGTPVFIGGGDVLCSAAAAIQKPGEFYINLGSAAWLGTLSPTPVLNPETRLVNYCHINSEFYAPHHAMTGAGICLQWLRDRIYPALSDRTGGGFDRMADEAAAVPAGSSGLVFLPYMRGIYAGRYSPDAKGVFFGLGLDHGNGHLCRAVMEGVALAMRELCGMMRYDGLEPKSLRLIGGGSRSRLWRQIFADICGVPVMSTVLRQEASSLGAAMAAGVGSGMFQSFTAAAALNPVDETCEPNHTHRQAYDDAYGVFIDLLRTLRPMFGRLA